MNKKIVLIADRVADFSDISLNNRDLECIPPKYYNEIYNSLSLISNGVIHYDSPKDFCQNILQHKDDIVLSIWSGIGSKYRKSLVPAICEANNICYVGADPYVHSVSQDKFLAKKICSQYKIKGAKDLLYKKKSDLDNLDALSLPLVVKPNFEGGSNGISENNLAYSYDAAIKMAHKLNQIFAQPILIEEYLEGTEICISIIGTSTKIDMLEASKLVINDRDYFKDTIYSYEPKVKNIHERKLQSATYMLDNELKSKFSDLFQNLGKVELLRIDGRINEFGIFSLIELTPDAYLGKRGSTTFCSQNIGIDYTRMLEILLENAYAEYQEREVTF